MTFKTRSEKTGNVVQVQVWKSSSFNYQVHIDGEFYCDASSLIESGDTEESEAAHQAEMVIRDLESDRLVQINGDWILLEEKETKEQLREEIRDKVLGAIERSRCEDVTVDILREPGIRGELLVQCDDHCDAGDGREEFWGLQEGEDEGEGSRMVWKVELLAKGVR